MSRSGMRVQTGFRDRDITASASALAVERLLNYATDAETHSPECNVLVNESQYGRFVLVRRLIESLHQELKWEQPSALRMEYELGAPDEPIATLRFRSSFGSLATVESADGCWTFKRVGFFEPRISVRVCGSETEIATFRNNTWSGGGALELPDRGNLKATTNFWKTRLEFRAENDESLIRFEPGGILHMHCSVEIAPQAKELLEKFPWLVSLGWYLIILLRSDSAAISASAFT
jgi:hypothetical protein